MFTVRLFSVAGLAAALAFPAGATAQDGVPKPEDLFKQLDQNGDGKLTADEVPENQRRFFDRSVRGGDKNSDGVLTLEEFVQANRPGDNPSVPLAPLAGGPARPAQGGLSDVRQRFQMLDRNKDGKISKDELPEQLRDRMLQMFERLGKNEISLEEFSRFSGGPPQPGEMFNRFDRNGDGKLTADELPAELPAELRERFTQAFERLGKRELTREDFAQVAGRLPGAGRPPGAPMGDGRPFQPALFRKLDKDGDGRVSKDELAKAADLFSELDENGDGQLDPRELIGFPADSFGPGMTGRPSAAPEAGRPNADGRPRSPASGDNPSGPIFARMDRNGDGKLSKDEAPERMRENFSRLDKDADGFLSPEELRGTFEQFGRPDGAGRPRRPATEPEKKE